MSDHKKRRGVALVLIFPLGSLLELTLKYTLSSQAFSAAHALLLIAVWGGAYYLVRSLRADTSRAKREPESPLKNKRKAKRTAKTRVKIDWSSSQTWLRLPAVCVWTLIHILVTGLTGYLILNLTTHSLTDEARYIFTGLWGLVALVVDADLFKRGLISWRGTLEYGIVGLLLNPVLALALAGLLAMMVSTVDLIITFIVAVPLYILMVLLLVFLPFLLLMQRVLRPLRRLEYGRAWRRAKWIMRWLHSGELEGMVLFFMGQYQAAHEIIQAHQTSALPSLIPTGTTNWELKIASQVWFEQGENEKALTTMLELVEASSMALTDLDCAAVLAEMYLRQGDNLPEALTLAAQSANSLWRWQEYSVNYTQPERIATHAWALAANGEHTAAQIELDRALHRLAHRPPLIQASVHYRAGQTHRLEGDEHRAREHFDHVVRLDPTGHYGRLGRAAQAVM